MAALDASRDRFETDPYGARAGRRRGTGLDAASRLDTKASDVRNITYVHGIRMGWEKSRS